MIRHIVLFKFKADLPQAAKQEKMIRIQIGLENLLDSVKSLKKMEVGINSNPNENYDLALTTEFESMDGLKAYSTNPEHLKVGGLIREILEERACVDYEF